MWNYAGSPEHRRDWAPAAPGRGQPDDSRYHHDNRYHPMSGRPHLYPQTAPHHGESSSSIIHDHRAVIEESRHVAMPSYGVRHYVAPPNGVNHVSSSLHPPYGPAHNGYRPSAPAAIGKSRLEQHLLPSQLTPSCSRCRQKKLKCQFEDRGPHAACTNCLAKGLEHECHRDLRTPRGKKGPAKAPTTIVNERNSEIAALKRRLSQLEDEVSSTGKKGPLSEEAELDERKLAADVHRSKFHRVDSHPMESHAGARSRPEAQYAARAETSSAPILTAQDANDTPVREFVPRATVVDSQSHALQKMPAQDRTVGRSPEECDAANVLEALARAANKTNQPVFSHVSIQGNHDTAEQSTQFLSQSRWETTSSDHEDRARKLVRDAKACLFMDDVAVTQELAGLFFIRLNQNIGHVVYIPGMKTALQHLASTSAEDLLVQKDWTSDPARLAVALLVLCLGWELYPDTVLDDEPPSAEFLAINAARREGKDPSRDWFSIARECLALEEVGGFKTIAALQAACLLLGYGQGGARWLRMVQLMATDSAQEFGLHRLGSATRFAGMDTASFVRLEIGVRIWNYLLLRDWCGIGASSHGRLAYNIQPEQCTTRLPLHLSDEELEAGASESKPLSVWTPLSVFVLHIKLAKIVREGIDIGRAESRHVVKEEEWRDGRPWRSLAMDEMSPQSIEKLQRRILDYIEDLPEHFSLNSELCDPRIIIAQRWQLHHELFDLTLALSRKGLASSVLDTFRADTQGTSDNTGLGLSIEPPGITCRRFARAIIGQHDLLRRVCPVLDSFAVHYTNLYSACIVGVMDLISRQLQKPSRFAVPPTKTERSAIRRNLQGIIERLSAVVSPSTEHPDMHLAGGALSQAHEHGTHILENLLAFEQEVSAAPVPLHSLDGPELAAQRRELAAMTRQICFEAGSSATQTAAALADEKANANRSLHAEDLRVRSDAHRPALLLPLSQCRKIPQSTLLPALGVWQPTCALSPLFEAPISSWPVVSITDEKSWGPSQSLFGQRTQFHEDDSIALTVLEWAVAMRGHVRSPPPQENSSFMSSKTARYVPDGVRSIPRPEETHFSDYTDRSTHHAPGESPSRGPVTSQHRSPMDAGARWPQPPSLQPGQDAHVTLPPLSRLHSKEHSEITRVPWNAGQRPEQDYARQTPVDWMPSDSHHDQAKTHFAGSPPIRPLMPRYSSSWRP